MTEPCRYCSLVDRHFGGAIWPPSESKLRAHLGTCERCLRRYERYLLLARLDPSIPSAEDRLARGLGLPLRRRTWPRPAVLALGLTAVLAVAFVRQAGPPEYAARGGTTMDAGQALYVYHIAPGGTPHEVVNGVIGSRDELAFAYMNRAGWSRLLVYAVDETGRVYWYHPGWTDATTAPVAVQIEPGPERHELPEAIAQPLPHGRVEIHAVFTDDAMTVQAIERGAYPAKVEELVIPIKVTDQESQ